MSRKRIGEDGASEQVPVGDVKDVLAVMEGDFDRGTVARLADTAEKRDEAIMCLRLIAGLDPRLRKKAEETIELLAKIPFPPVEEH
ncbi:MAG: hypothetical protein ACR2O4_17250 [Hyphomicrobiaceae bacterium]